MQYHTTALLLMIAAGAASAAPPRTLPGWPIYERSCAPCHGSAGDGHGPAATLTRGAPRAFARGEYEWRTTPAGKPPTDADLRAAITFGAAGTSMPAFGDVLAPAQIDQLIDVVKAFAPAAFATPGKPVVLGAEVAANPARGAALWTELACDKCHGARGRGDGAAAAKLAEPPYDLTGELLRRPREHDDAPARRRAAAWSIATGMTGTAMPGYAGQIPDADVWALADQVVALGAGASDHRAVLEDEAIAADRKQPVATGTWPGNDADDARVFGGAIALQGPPPASLAPAQASLRAPQCGRCHAKQVREWQGSLHAQTTAAGFSARAHGLGMADDTSCARCHAPLAEQDASAGRAFDAELRGEGVTCAGCHVRSWVRRGPPRVAPSLLPATGYPLVELSLYERSDFCMACHQLPARTAVAGKPLLDTYREWLEGPYMKRGVQCQSCHMPNREHQWLGVHDRDTFRQGIRVTARAKRGGNGAVTVWTELENIGAGHRLPTTATPAVWLRVELYDARGVAIRGARDDQRIARDVEYTANGWVEHADTRIAPGQTLAFARAWKAGRTADAAFARITVEVYPDDYYERLYARELASRLAPEARTLYERAAARARASHYIAEQHDVKIEVSSK